MNRSLIPLLLLSACSLHAATVTGAGTAPTAAAGPAAAAAAAGACDAANNHCLPAGVQFNDSGEAGKTNPVSPCVEHDGVWVNVSDPDIVCKGRDFHRTDPTATVEVGALVIRYSSSSHEPDGLPGDEKRARVGRWIRMKVENVDTAAGTFNKSRLGPGFPLAGARVVVETRTVD